MAKKAIRMAADRIDFQQAMYDNVLEAGRNRPVSVAQGEVFAAVASDFSNQVKEVERRQTLKRIDSTLDRVLMEIVRRFELDLDIDAFNQAMVRIQKGRELAALAKLTSNEFYDMCKSDPKYMRSLIDNATGYLKAITVRDLGTPVGGQVTVNFLNLEGDKSESVKKRIVNGKS